MKLPDRYTGKSRTKSGRVVFEAFGAYIDGNVMYVPSWAVIQPIKAGQTIYFEKHKVRAPSKMVRDLKLNQLIMLEVI